MRCLVSALGRGKISPRGEEKAKAREEAFRRELVLERKASEEAKAREETADAEDKVRPAQLSLLVDIEDEEDLLGERRRLDLPLGEHLVGRDGARAGRVDDVELVHHAAGVLVVHVEAVEELAELVAQIVRERVVLLLREAGAHLEGSVPTPWGVGDDTLFLLAT